MLLLSAVAATIASVSGCSARHKLAPGVISEIRCEYTFHNTVREDADRIQRVAERYRLEDYPVYIEVGDDSVYCEFTVYSLAEIQRMHDEFRYLPQLRQAKYVPDQPGQATQKLAFEELNPVLKLEYHTAQLEAGLTMTVSFKISPGAKLFFAAEGDREAEVHEDFIDKNGNVELPIAIEEGQKYIYGRTILGNITKCIRVNIYTGETQEVSLDEYLKYVFPRN
jgi:hypothetical protein